MEGMGASSLTRALVEADSAAGMVHLRWARCGVMASMVKKRVWGWLSFAVLLSMVMRAGAANPPEWTTPIAPFRITDNLYYVGSKDLASYLVVTKKGDILINSSLEASVPLIEKSVEKLGFRMTDIKILLISHAHSDHDAGSAAILKLTMTHTQGIHGQGAKYMVMDGDVPVVESGGAKDFAYPNDRYPPAKVDRVLYDGDEVRLGGAVLVAHKTAGHTRGCTTWTMRVMDEGHPRDVVIVGSWNVNPGFRLVDQPAKNGKPGQPASYPGIAADYKKTFVTLKSLPCDIFLGAHGQYFDMLAKVDRIKAGAGESVWIDPEGYKAAVAEREQAFEAELAKQTSAR
jgi:metallo-beta-lactamase class B